MQQTHPAIRRFFDTQLHSWPLAQAGNDALAQAQTRELHIDGQACPIRIQHNPARIRSTAANVDSTSLSRRPCFLCACNRPHEQTAMPAADGFELLVNPYPILHEHLTIAATQHQPQSLKACWDTMQTVLDQLGDDFMVFYNGPHCGASAPDHLHIQAGRWQGVPLIEHILAHRDQFAASDQWDGNLCAPLGYALCVERRAQSAYFASHAAADDVNVAMVHDLVIFIPRRKHRPDCFYATDNTHHLISPGTLDMCGLVIAPDKADFEQLRPEETLALLRECGKWQQPTIHVGITKAKHIDATQHDGYFTLRNVTIGVNFHWQRREDQQFRGKLRLVPEGYEQWAVNDIPLEDYLTSVVSSEMNAHAPLEFLKAHAIVSRSWLIAQLERKRNPRPAPSTQAAEAPHTAGTQPHTAGGTKETTYIRFYDRDDHTLFDVCADDHCQRYQGMARITEAATEAVRSTRGQVLTYGGKPLDARFSKCCGGMSERYETCWDDTPHPEFSAVADRPDETAPQPDKPGPQPAAADTQPAAADTDFCDTHDDALLATILNNYDAGTHDFYSWRVSYSQQELSRLVREKSGIDVGTVTALTPLRRGASGRICLLRIEGTRGTLTVGKELEIRRLLSPTHLYSSWFNPSLADGKFTLDGRGWGHGVGMCQIGAAVMAARGYNCRQILAHYYPKARLEHIYD